MDMRSYQPFSKLRPIGCVTSYRETATRDLKYLVLPKRIFNPTNNTGSLSRQ